MNDLQELLDREAIRNYLFRYCRGIDRGDEVALSGAYWPDATDHHGPYSGSAQGFIDFALKTIKATEPGIHQMHNILIEFQDGGALVETYFQLGSNYPALMGSFLPTRRVAMSTGSKSATTNGRSRRARSYSIGPRRCPRRKAPAKNASRARSRWDSTSPTT